MVWEQWVLIIVFCFGSISAIAIIGEERKAITKGTAVIQLIVSVILIYLVIRITR